MTRGPVPTRPEIKSLRGTAQRVIRHESKPSVPPECPNWLPEGAKEFWIDLIPKLSHLTAADGQALALLAMSLDQVAKAAEELDKSGALAKDKRGRLAKNPSFQIWRDSSILAKGFMAELGLTPAARARANISSVAEQLSDEERFIRG